MRHLRCKEQVTKIAVNEDDTIAYVCCGAQNDIIHLCLLKVLLVSSEGALAEL